MPSKHPLMKLSRDEELFLRHWMYDEVHYLEGQGPAKQLQVQHGAIAADLGTLIIEGLLPFRVRPCLPWFKNLLKPESKGVQPRNTRTYTEESKTYSPSRSVRSVCR